MLGLTAGPSTSPWTGFIGRGPFDHPRQTESFHRRTGPGCHSESFGKGWVLLGIRPFDNMVRMRRDRIVV